IQSPEGEAAGVYAIGVELFLTDWARSQRYSFDTTRTLQAARTLGKGEYLSLAQEFPAHPGTFEAALVVEVGDSLAGQVSTLARLTIPASGSRLALSDIVLGQEQGPLKWQSPAGLFTLNPLNAYSRNRSAE